MYGPTVARPSHDCKNVRTDKPKKLEHVLTNKKTGNLEKCKNLNANPETQKQKNLNTFAPYTQTRIQNPGSFLLSRTISTPPFMPTHLPSLYRHFTLTLPSLSRHPASRRHPPCHPLCQPIYRHFTVTLPSLYRHSHATPPRATTPHATQRKLGRYSQQPCRSPVCAGWRESRLQTRTDRHFTVTLTPPRRLCADFFAQPKKDRP
jgi:hypothetical protein